ncbi:MAG: putative Holliday junction resolvase [Myxococcota bacterium]|jgi:putative Holliday junction resolvase
MRILGLDMGTKRIGMAISDEEETFAFPTGKLERVGRKKDLATLAALIEEREVGLVVIGIPLHMNGQRSKGADAAESFAKDLAKLTGLTVDTIDERLTTVEAERALTATGRRSKKKKDVVDSVAASIILSTYLSLKRNSAERVAALRTADDDS